MNFTTKTRRHFLKTSSALAGGTALASTPLGSARAQSGYPTKPVKFIIPFPPGGTTDIVGRLMAQALTTSLGQSFVVESRGGGGGTIGGAEIARAAPDGYTIGMGTVSTLGTAPVTFKKLAYDPLKDYVPIVQVAAVPGIVVVHPSFPAKTWPEFMKVVKANPGKYNYGSSGTNGVGHMGMELLKSQTGLFITHIGYRGAGPALTDVLAGNVPILWDNLSSSLPHIKSGKLIALGLAYDNRIPQLPDVPTFAELGLKNYHATTWFGLVGPTGIPAEIVTKLNSEVNRLLQTSEIKQRMMDAGAFPMGGTSAQMGEAIKTEIAKWAKVVQFAKLTLE